MKYFSFFFALMIGFVLQAQSLKPPFAVQDSSKVLLLEGGVKCYVVREGNGRQPKATDEVHVNYHGRLTNGKVFDSSFDRNESISFPLNGVIKGWQIGFQAMKEGALFVLVIPPAYAYGSRDMGSIPPNSTLVFDCEFINIGGKNDRPVVQEAAPSVTETSPAKEVLPPPAPPVSPVKKKIKQKQIVGKWLVTDISMKGASEDEQTIINMMKEFLLKDEMVFEFKSDGTNLTSSKSTKDAPAMKYTLKNNIIEISASDSQAKESMVISMFNKKEMALDTEMEGKTIVFILKKQ